MKTMALNHRILFCIIALVLLLVFCLNSSTRLALSGQTHTKHESIAVYTSMQKRFNDYLFDGLEPKKLSS